MNTKYCFVNLCRFPESHTTEGHLCGVCKKFGHGHLECGNQVQIQNLKFYDGMTLPKAIRCPVTGCKTGHNHTGDAHHCEICLESHSVVSCPSAQKCDPFDDVRPEEILRRQKYDLKMLHQLLKPRTFVVVHEGMGCTSYIRKTPQGVLEGLFMHSDDWAYNPKKVRMHKMFTDRHPEITPIDLIDHYWTGVVDFTGTLKS